MRRTGCVRRPLATAPVQYATPAPLFAAPAPGGLSATDLATVERCLEIARRELGMEAAFLGEFSGGREVFRAVDGDAARFDIAQGTSADLGGSFCTRMVGGRIGNVVPDSHAEPELAQLEGTTEGGVGAYVGVPVRFSDGRVYGAFCCVSHAAEPELAHRDIRFMHMLASLVADQIEQRKLDGEAWRAELEASAAGALLAALDARDGYTGAHSQTVLELARAVGCTLGLAAEELVVLEQVALLHDIGKIGIPDHVLRKTGPLDAAEWQLMRAHPEIGAQIVKSIPSLAHLAPLVEADHERWDGGGYPNGLADEAIPLAARIIFACDAYDAMTTDRPYRPAMPSAEAQDELRRCAGTQFDPRVVAALERVIGRRAAAAA